MQQVISLRWGFAFVCWTFPQGLALVVLHKLNRDALMSIVQGRARVRARVHARREQVAVPLYP